MNFRGIGVGVFENTVYSLVEPLKWDGSRLEALKRLVNSRDDSLVGGFEAFAGLWEEEGKGKAEFIDTIEKLVLIRDF